MELNITLTELMLFCWAILATGAAIKFKDEAVKLRIVLITFIEDDEARTKILQTRDDMRRKLNQLRGQQ